MIYFKLTIALLLFLHITTIKCTNYEPVEGYVANTRHGKVKGTVRYATKTHVSSNPVYSFFGIPYGRSPDYSFRFHDALDPWTWDGVKNVTEENVPLCMQSRRKLNRVRKNTIKKFFFTSNNPMKEDCLNLNVFTPVNPKLHKNKLLPVILWIHGGSLQTSSTPHQMWGIPAYYDVIVVTIQYRLGPFGFMTMNDETAPANVGLRDQVKAILWIRENVEEFGGNKDKVTIMGQSAGGFSASALMLSPYSEGLFNNVILLSGVAIKQSLWEKNQSEKTKSIAKALGCDLGKNGLSMTCLRNRITSNQIINATEDLNFKAEIDNDFFLDSVDSLLKKGKFNNQIPVMIGSVAGEYDFLLGRKRIQDYESGNHITKSDVQRLIKNELRNYYDDSLLTKEFLKSLYEEYLNETSSYHKSLVDFMSDFHFVLPIDTTAHYLKASGSKVYMYNFAHSPSFYENSKLGINRPYNYNRADHSDDWPFFLGLPFIPKFRNNGITFTEAEENLSLQLMKAVASFATHGKPAFDDTRKVWKEYPSHLFVNNSEIKFKNSIYNEKRIKFLRSLFNEEIY